MNSVTVPVPNQNYEIYIGTDIYGSIKLPQVSNRHCLIVTDSNVGPLYQKQVIDLLVRNGATAVDTVDFPAGEASKNLSTMQTFYSFAAKKGLDRKSIIITLGGGVTGDMGGFLAASYMRGIDFIQFPTSLLAMVDSSVGGKVGIDLPEGKNLVGAFWQPLAVVADLATLKTLPVREVKSGLAEVVKYGMIYDQNFLTFLENNCQEFNKLNLEIFEEVVSQCCQIKAKVVSEDEREQGIRAILNYGHTFGHSIEMLGEYSLLNHGEAVAIGMNMAANLSVEKNWITPELVQRQLELLTKIGLPTTISKLSPTSILQGMYSDKKVEAGTIRLVLPKGDAGRVIISNEITEEEIINAIKSGITE
jgi:3-dehydroquinate synthase